MSKLIKQSSTNLNYIKFYPDLKSAIGCERATLIVGKLEYFFSISKFQEGFYKFVEPCFHPLYRIGDSWSEELGISRKVFNRAFDVIGIRYKSKTDFLKSEDKFKSKLYASYHDRATNQTYYVRNHEFASQFFERVFKKKAPSVSSTLSVVTKNEEKSQELLTEIPKELPQKIQEKVPSECRSRNGTFGHSYTRESFSFHNKTSSLEINQKASPAIFEQEERTLTEGMIKIWNEEIGDLGSGMVTEGFLKRLLETLQVFFDMSLESWRKYCRMISSSKFLMGEAQNKFFKKAWITWAIKAESIKRIQGGGFTLGDRQTNEEKEIETINVEIRKIETEKENIEEKIKNIEDLEKRKRKEIIKKKIETISTEEKAILEKDFEALLEQENNSLTEEFRKFRWKGKFISAYFDEFVEEKLSSSLFKTSLKEAQNQAIQSSGLLKVLQNISDELSFLKGFEPLKQKE